MQTTLTEEAVTDVAALGAADLVRRCARLNCAASWQEFLARYRRVLAAAVRRTMNRVGRVLSRDLQDDLLQDVYCHLLADERRRLRRCRATDERTVIGYLCRVAENVVLDHLRQHNAAKRGRGVLVVDEGREGPGALDGAADPQAAADRGALVAECRRLFLSRAGAALRGRHRRRDLWVLYLALFESWSSREIASGLGGLTANNVDSIVHRAKRRLGEAGIDLSAVSARR